MGIVNAFTAKLCNGKDFSVDHFIIDYMIGCGWLGKEYDLGVYDKETLLAELSKQMRETISLQEGFALRKKIILVEELFDSLPHTNVLDNEVIPPYVDNIRKYPKSVEKEKEKYKKQSEKSHKAGKYDESDYYYNIAFYEEAKSRVEYLAGLSESEKVDLNEKIKQNKIEQLEQSSADNRITLARYKNMIAAINEWNPQGENAKLFGEMKEKMIVMLKEGIEINSFAKNNEKIEAEIKELRADDSKTKLVEKELQLNNQLKDLFQQQTLQLKSKITQDAVKKPK